MIKMKSLVLPSASILLAVFLMAAMPSENTAVNIDRQNRVSSAEIQTADFYPGWLYESEDMDVPICQCPYFHFITCYCQLIPM